jgi:hypothetical protein
MASDREALDDAKRRFFNVKQEIETLRTKIATEKCPLKIGDKVTVVDVDREYEGIIEYIQAANGAEEIFHPIVGAEPGWVAGGQRINKTTGNAGKRSFGINSFASKLVDAKWVVTRRTFPESLEDALGMLPLKGTETR